MSSNVFSVYTGNISNLTKLILSYNNLTGTIPPNFAKLTKLRQLSLDHNNLVGEIPEAIYRSLIRASGLDFSYNNLSGHISPYIQQMADATLTLFSIKGTTIYCCKP